METVEIGQRVMEPTQPDLVTCSCNVCDGHLQFERQQAGERVNCPRCGMETLLYVPQGAPKLIAILPAAPISSIVAEAPPVIRQPRTPFPPREILKWLVIVWSGLCAMGIMLLFASVAWNEVWHPKLSSSNQYEAAGAFLGHGLVFFALFLVWAVVALPVVLLWIITKKE